MSAVSLAPQGIYQRQDVSWLQARDPHPGGPRRGALLAGRPRCSPVTHSNPGLTRFTRIDEQRHRQGSVHNKSHEEQSVPPTAITGDRQAAVDKTKNHKGSRHLPRFPEAFPRCRGAGLRRGTNLSALRSIAEPRLVASDNQRHGFQDDGSSRRLQSRGELP